MRTPDAGWRHFSHKLAEQDDGPRFDRLAQTYRPHLFCRLDLDADLLYRQRQRQGNLGAHGSNVRHQFGRLRNHSAVHIDYFKALLAYTASCFGQGTRVSVIFAVLAPAALVMPT